MIFAPSNDLWLPTSVTVRQQHPRQRGGEPVLASPFYSLIGFAQLDKPESVLLTVAKRVVSPFENKPLLIG